MGTAVFNGNSNYYIDVDAALVSQNVGGNYSTISWHIDVVKTAGYGFSAYGMGSSGWADASYVGRVWSDGDIAYNFMNGSNTGRWTIASGRFNIQHRSDGNAEYYVNGGLNLYALGSASAGTGWRSLPRINRSTIPDAPTAKGFGTITQTSIQYLFSDNGNGGSAILERQVEFQESPSGSKILVSTNSPATITQLKPGTLYNFWSRVRNANGWSAWSGLMQQRTRSGARVKYGGTWRDAIPYVKVNGVWRAAEPYVKSGGNWRKTG